MNELLREIQEDIRQDRLQQWWRQFGKTVIGLSLAVVFGTVVGVTWKHYRQGVNMDRTAMLIKNARMTASGNYDEALAAGKELEGSVHGDIAQLQQARIHLEKGEKEKAQEIYRRLSTHASYRAFADLAKFESAKEKDAPMEVDGDAAFVHLQTEMRAWQLLESGKKDEAAQLFFTLKDEDSAPQGLRLRAAAALAYLAPEHQPAEAADE